MPLFYYCDDIFWKWRHSTHIEIGTYHKPITDSALVILSRNQKLIKKTFLSRSKDHIMQKYIFSMPLNSFDIVPCNPSKYFIKICMDNIKD